MKLVRWEFLGLHMPMMEDDNGELYCTSKAICDALGIDKHTMEMIVSRNKDEFGSLRLTNCGSKDGGLRVTDCYSKDLSVSDCNASEDDMLTFAFHSKSPQSLEFRKQLRRFIKQNATQGYVTQAQFDELKGHMHSLMELVAMLAAL